MTPGRGSRLGLAAGAALGVGLTAGLAAGLAAVRATVSFFASVALCMPAVLFCPACPRLTEPLPTTRACAAACANAAVSADDSDDGDGAGSADGGGGAAFPDEGDTLPVIDANARSAAAWLRLRAAESLSAGEAAPNPTAFGGDGAAVRGALAAMAAIRAVSATLVADAALVRARR